MKYLATLAAVGVLACGTTGPTVTVPPTLELYAIGADAAVLDSVQTSWDIATAWFTERTGLTLKSDNVVRSVAAVPQLPDSVKALVFDLTVTTGDRCGGAYVGGQVGGAYPNVPACWTPWGLWSVNQPARERWMVPTYREKATIHEIMHLLGAVPHGAPNGCGSDHVCDDNTDIMWEESITGRNVEFDAARDDYWHIIANSPWVR